jgi:hypothetical protein
MIRFRIEIEAAAGDPEAVNILLKTDRDQVIEAEEESARRLLPALRALLQTRFPETDESQQPPEAPSPHRMGRG